ncbi:hypothetical protein BGZ68_010358 [Mortierella alpina]|nr:hypothetical protein BGZ68_010358 [Mortierella alpina]
MTQSNLSVSANAPRIILGAMTFGLEGSSAETTVKVKGVEAVLSMLPTAHLKIATKVYPGFPGAHEAEHLSKQFRQSLTALKTQKVDILYLHAPDYATPFEVTLKAIDDLYREGHFERFGLSNFASWHVAQICELCKQHGYVQPSVYQGMHLHDYAQQLADRILQYNPIARSVVPELLPCLKEYNIGFYAYNPIGGGLLSGKYKGEDEVIEGSRYDPKTFFGKFFRERYWNRLNLEGVQLLSKAAAENHLTLLEATLRWMRHHSGLEAKDGILIGASSMRHLEENLVDLEKGPLPQAMVDAFDEAWEHVKAASAHYVRGPAAVRHSFGITKE